MHRKISILPLALVAIATAFPGQEACAANPAITITSQATTAAQPSSPSTGQWIWTFKFTSDGTTARKLTGVSISEMGSVDATGSLNNIWLYQDTDGTYDGSESSLGFRGTFDSTQKAVYTGLSSLDITSAQPLYVHVVLDVLFGAGSNTIQLRIAGSADRTYSGTVSDPTSYPVTSGAVSISPIPGFQLTRQIGKSNLSSNTTNQRLGTFAILLNSASGNTLSSFAVAENGTIGASTQLANIKMFGDSDPDYSNGTLGQLGATTSFDGADGTASFGGLSFPLSTTLQYLHLVGDVAAGTAGKSVGLRIASAADVSLSPAASDYSTYAVDLNASIVDGRFYYVRADAPDDLGVVNGDPAVAADCWKTVAGAFAKLKTDESSTLVGKGPYTIEIRDASIYNEVVNLTGLATSTADTLTLRAVPGQLPRIVNGNTNHCLQVAISNFTLEGIRVSDSTTYAGVYLSAAVSGITLKGCSVVNNRYGIYEADVALSNLRITHTRFYGNDYTAFSLYAARTRAHTNVTIDHCRFFSNAETSTVFAGVELYGTLSGGKVYNNVFHDNSVASTNADTFNADLYIANTCTQVLLANNIWYTTNTDVNQLFISAPSAGAAPAPPVIDPRSDYNCFYSTDNSDPFIWDTGTYKTLAGWRTATGADDTGSFEQDPLFVDAINSNLFLRDYHLRSTFGIGPSPGTRHAADSPCIDAGVPRSPTAGGSTLSRVYVRSTLGFPSSQTVTGVVYAGGDDFTYTSKTDTWFDGVADLSAAPGAGVIVQYLVDVDYSDFTAEVEDNGDRVDLGAYGNTDTASLSGVSWVGGDGITWTGDGGTSSWADPLNWSNRRVPLSTDDVFIPDRDFDPILDAVAECRDLTISNYPNDSPAATGGTLTLEDDAFTLSIGGDLTVQGSPATTWNHTGGAVSVAGDVTLTGNFSNTGGTFTLNGTSVAGQAVAAANPTFHSLTIDNTGPGATVAMPSGGWAVALDCTIESADAVTFGTGTVTVGGDLTKNSAGTLTATSGTLSVAGDFSIGAGGFVHNAGTVTLNGTSNQALVTGGSAFSTLFLDNGAAAAVLTTTGNLIVASDLTLTASNEALFVIRDGAHSCTGSVTVSGGTMGFSPSTSGLFTAGGPFTVAAGAALTLSGPSVLRLPSTGLIVHGSLSALADTARPKITTSGTEGGSAAADHYALDFSPAGASDTINLYGIDISSPDADGLDINANGGQVARLDDINFTNGNYGTQSPDAYTNTYLTLRGVASGTYTFRLSRFDRHCRYNVKLRGFGGLPGTSTAVITMENAGGEKGDADGGDTPAGGGETWTGEGRDGDPDGDAHITWDYFKKWIGSVNTMWSLGANWQGGTAPRTSAPFEDVLIEPGQPWDPVLDVDASVNSFTIGAGGAMSLNTTTRTFTIQGDNFRTFGGSMDPGNGTIVFSGTAMQEVNVGINPIYNVVVRKSGGTVRLAANLVVRNDFDLEDGTVDLAGYALTIGDPAYGSSMGFTLDSDNDADGTLLMGTTSALTTRRSAVTNRATISMTGTSLWNAADSAGSPDDNTITLGPASGSGGSLSMTDSARIVVGDGDGTDALLTQGAAIFTMTAVSGAAPRLEAATGSASLTFNAPFRTVRYASSKPTITRRLVDSGYFGVLLTDIVDIQGLSISFANTGGVNVAASATLTNLNFIEFASVQPGSDSGHLKIARAAPGALVSEGCSFDDSYGATGGNIYLANSGGPTFTLTMSNAAGVGAGDAEEDTIPGTVSEGAGAEIEWVSRKAWAGRYRYKLRLRVTNGAGSPLPGGAPVEYTFDDSGAGIGGKHENTGNDVRVVYDDGTVVRELDRVLIRRYSDSGWGTASTQRTLAFPTQSSIGAGAFDNNYYLYYGYPNAGAPPADPEAVGVVFFDGLEGNSFTAGEWIVSSPASCIVTSATKNSGTYSARGETATSTLTFTRALSPGLASNLRLYFARSTSDLGTNDDVGFAAKYSVDGGGTFPNVFESNANMGVTAWSSASHSFGSTPTHLRFEVWYTDGGSPGLTVGMYANFDDVRLYANHNGTLPGCTADGSEMDRGAPGASLPWSEGFNWDPPGVPEPNSAVSIDDTVTDYAYAPSLDVTSAVTVLSLDLRNTSPGALTLVASANPLSITRDIGFGVAGGATSGSISSTNGRTIRVGGDWTLHTGSAFGAGTGAVEFNGGIAQSIAGSGSTTFGNLSVNPGVTGTVLTVNPASGVVTTVSGTLSVAPLQELVVASNRTLVVASAGSSGTAVNVDGILTLTNGSTLDLEGKAAPDFTSLSVAAGGLLRTSGTTSSSRAMITSSDVAIDGDGYAITVAEGSGVNLDLYDVRYPGVDGFRVNGAAALAGLDNGRFDYPSIGGVLLNFTAHSHALLQTISGCDFRNTGGATGAFNVRGGAGAGQHGIITFTDVTGAFSGEAFDDDPQALVVWPDTPGPVVPELVVAIAEDASGGGMGIQFGDRVILTFDDPTNEYDVTQSPGVDANLILSGGHSWGSIISAVWTTPSTLTLTLGSGATVVAGDSMTFAANTVESTSGGYDATDTPVTIITGTFGADTPDMDLAWADDPEATQVGGAETGDVVVVRFTRPVNAFNITSGNIDTVLRPAGGAHSWGSPISATYSGTTTPLSSAWTGGAVLNVGDTSDFPAAMAAANTVFVHGDDFTYTGKTAGTFTGVAGLSGDKDAGALIYRRDTTTLTAAYTGGGTIEVGDASAFASSVTTALTAFVSGDDFTYTGRTGTTFTGVSGLSNKNSGAPVYYGDVDTLVIRLEVGNTTATVAVTDTLTIGAYTIMDRQGINTAVGSSPSIAGDFGASLLALTGAVAADPAPETSGSGPGDIVTLTFDNPTNAYPITAGNIATTLPLAGSDPPGGPAGPTWGTIASAIWSNANRTLTITLGSGSDILAAGDAGGDNTLTVAAGTIKDSSGTNDASPVPVALSNSFGTAPLPTLQSVLAEDYSDGGPGVQDGDRVIFTFDNATDGDSTSISTLVPLTAGSWGGLQNPPPGGGSQQWLDGNRILVIYLDSTDCTISPAITQVRDNPTSSGRNAYIESSAGDPTGTDAFTSNDSLGWPRTIGGSFGAGIAGYVYDDPDSPVGVSGVMVHFIVNGEDRGAIGPTGASGFFSRSMTVAAGDRMLVYLDNGAAPYASAVTVKGAGDSIGDLNLYQDHLILRNHSGAVTANTDVATAVGAWGDLDIRFSVSGTALSLNAGPPDQTLYVLNDYAPGGTVTLGGITHVRVGNGTLSPGAIALSVTGDLRIDAGTLDMDPAGTLNVSGDLAVASGGTLDGTGVSSTLRVGGDWTMDGVYNPGSITVGFNGSGTQTISSASGTNTFSRINVGIDTSATTVVLGNDVTVSTSSSGSFVGEGTLRLNGKTLTLAGSTSYEVLSGATLQLDAGSRLAVANNATVTINPGGALQTSGTTSLSRAEITRSGTSGAYSIVVNGAVNLNCYRAIYLDANGLQIGAGATVSSFDNGEFDFPVAGGTFLNFSAYTGGARLRLVGCRFTNSPGVAGASNVTADAAEPTNEVTLAGWFGDFGGEDFDSDPNGRIDWTQDSFTLMSGGTDLATYGDLQSALDAAAANSIVESRGSGWTDLSLLPGGTATFPNQAGVILRNAFLANGSIQGSGGAAGSRGTLRNCFVALAAAGQNLGGTWTLDSVDACTVVEEVDDTIVRITADTVRNVAYTGASGEISGSQTTCSTGVVAATAFTDAARRDYHVRADASSLIDQGTNLGFAPADDIDGNLRGIDDTLTADGGDLSRWDIGADEYGAVRVGALSTPGSVPLWSSASVAGGLFGRIQAPPTYFFSNGLLYVGTSGGGAMHNSSLLALNASTGAVVRSIDLAQEIDFADDGGDNNTVASAWVSTQPIAFRYSSSPLTDIIALAVDTDDTSDGLADLDGVPDKIVFVKDDGAALSRYTAFSSNGVLDLNDGASALFQPVGPPTFALDGGSIWMFLPSAISGGGAVGYCKYDLTGARTWTYDVHPPDYRSPIFYNRMMGRSYLGLTGSADGNDTVSVNATGVGDWQRAMGSAIVNRRPMIWISQGSATSWIMAAPEASSAFAIKGDNGELRWTTPDLGGTPTSGCINPTFYSWAYVGAGEHLCKFNRVTGVLAADGDAPGEDWSTTDWLEGRMTTNLVAWSQKLFFGTERGYFYQVKCTNSESAAGADADGQNGAVAGFPYRVAGARIMGVMLTQVGGNKVFLVTDDGRIVAFVFP